MCVYGPAFASRQSRKSCSKRPSIRKCGKPDFFVILSFPRPIGLSWHAFIEADMGVKPALQAQGGRSDRRCARSRAASLPARARLLPIPSARIRTPCTISPHHEAMAPRSCACSSLFIPDAVQLRQEARNHARSLTQARDGQSALNAFDDLVGQGNGAVGAIERGPSAAGSKRFRGSGEQAVLTPELRDAIHRLGSIPATARHRSMAASILSTSVRSRRAWRPATAKRGGAFRAIGPTRAPKICINCGSAWSITAIRWSWSSPLWPRQAGCGLRKPNDCATDSAAVRTGKSSSASPGRNQPLAHLALRGDAGPAPSAPPSFSYRGRPHRAAPVAERPKGVPAPAGNAMGARPLKMPNK